LGDANDYETIMAQERAFLAAVDDSEIRALYLAAKGGDADAEKKLGGIAIGNLLAKPTRPMTPREQTADRAFKILYWLKQNMH
jgi:hypothetical protein